MNKNIIGFTVLTSLIIMISPFTAHADTWGAAMAAALEKQALENMEKQIWEASEVAAKQAAVMIVNDSIQMLMTGNNGQSLVISNPLDYLFGEPHKQAASFMDSFFSITARGRDSAGNYHAFGSSGGKMSYEGELVNGARASLGLGGSNSGSAQINLRNYCPNDPKDIFGNGDWRCYNAITSHPLNNPYGYTLAAQSAYASQYARAQQTANAKFIANKGVRNITDSKGNVLTPGSFVFEVQVGSLKLPLDMLANADGSAAVTFMQAAATKVIISTIQQGIGYARSRIQQEINTPLQRMNKTINEKVKIQGPQMYWDPYNEKNP